MILCSQNERAGVAAILAPLKAFGYTQEALDMLLKPHGRRWRRVARLHGQRRATGVPIPSVLQICNYMVHVCSRELLLSSKTVESSLLCTTDHRQNPCCVPAMIPHVTCCAAQAVMSSRPKLVLRVLQAALRPGERMSVLTVIVYCGMSSFFHAPPAVDGNICREL